MNTRKKLGSLLLALALVCTPTMINAQDMENEIDKDLINEDMDLIDEGVNPVEIKEYLTYEGYIADVHESDGKVSIWVESEEDKENPLGGTIFHIDEDALLLSDKTMENIEKDYLKEEMKVLVFYRANTPMTMSLPPQMTPDGIVVRENENLRSIKLSNFNDELTSIDNQLMLNIQEDTLMIDKNGEKLEKEDLKDEDLLVFYSVTTRSIPAQTSPQAVILLDVANIEDDVEVTVFDRILLDVEDHEKSIKVLGNQIYTNEEGVLMIPLREFAEALGYEVTWDGEKRAVQLTKGAQWTEVVIGKDVYNFAKMIVKLGTAPVLKETTTYVPLNFLEDVLQMSLNLDDGMLKIME